MPLLKIAAFSDGPLGGNPAGVWIGEALPPSAEMQRIAADVGFSETAFAASQGSGWSVRYFSPESEVPFCGHATIALGAALAQREGDGVFSLSLAHAQITVEGRRDGDLVQAALQSPPTRSGPLPDGLLDRLLTLFGLAPADLDPRIPPALIHGGASHAVLALRSRAALAAMHYALDAGRTLMLEGGWSPSCWWLRSQASCCTRATRLPREGCSKTLPRAQRPPPSQAICATWAGPMAAPSTWCRAKTWACARACEPRSGRCPAAPSAFRARRGGCAAMNR